MGQWQLKLNSCKQNPNDNVMSCSTKIDNYYMKIINSFNENLSRKVREA